MQIQKKHIYHVYLDMDGVLTDLDLNMVDKWKKGGKFQYNFKKFIDKNGFLNLGMKDDAHELLNYLNDSGVKVTILSSAGNPESGYYEKIATQKKIWLRKNHINYPAIVVQKKNDKKDYASPHALLIDDTKSNIEEFSENGGYSLYYTTAEDAIKNFKEKYDLKG